MALVSQDRCEAIHYGEPDSYSSTSLRVAFSILSRLHSFACVRRIEYGETFPHRMEAYVVGRTVEFESRWLRARPYTIQQPLSNKIAMLSPEL
jgi:hypothetical protein